MDYDTARLDEIWEVLKSCAVVKIQLRPGNASNSGLIASRLPRFATWATIHRGVSRTYSAQLTSNGEFHEILGAVEIDRDESEIDLDVFSTEQLFEAEPTVLN